MGYVGNRETIYLSLHCHHQNDSCIKMGSDVSHFNVSLIVRDKATQQCHKPQPNPSAYQLNTLLLGQMGSQ